MAQYNIKGPLTDDSLNKINHMFDELYKKYTGAGLDAAEAREKAIQAVTDAAIAKETAEVTREEMLAIIREQTQNGDLAPEIAQARQGKETLGENLNSIKSDLAQTNEKMEYIAYTMNNIVFDGVTDNYSDIQYIIDNHSGKIVFPPETNIYLSQPLYLTESNISEIDFNGAWVSAPNGVSIDGRRYDEKAVLLNATLDGVSSSNNSLGVDLGKERFWGVSIKLKNIYIRRFKIGLYCNSVFDVATENTKIGYCLLGAYFHNDDSVAVNTTFSNQNIVNGLYIVNCKYGFYTHDTQNALFLNHTYEFNDYGIVIGKDLRNITFLNTWFENNNIANVTAGIIDLDTLELTKASNEEYFKGVTFLQTRYNTDNTSPSLFDNHFPFVSKYKTFGGNRDGIYETIATNEFAYENLIGILPTSLNNVANQVVETTPTPFGNLFVARGWTGGTPFNRLPRYKVNVEKERIKMGNVYLLKALVYVSKPNEMNSEHIMNLQLTNETDSPLTNTWEGDVRILTERWVAISTVVKVTRHENLDNSQYKLQVFFNRAFGSERPDDPYYLGEMDISVTNLMAVNLTEVFGLGNEPQYGSEKIISPYFPYKHGNTNMPRTGRYVGEVFFHKGTQRYYVWTGSIWGRIDLLNVES